MQDSTPQLIVGRKPVWEILSQNQQVDLVLIQKGSRQEEIIDLCRRQKIRFRLTDKKELDKIYKGNHQGVIARKICLGFADFEQAIEIGMKAEFPLILALDQVQDTGNVGTIARTLFALGGKTILVPKNRSAFLGPAALKASAGALAKMQVAQVTNLSRALDDCREKGLPIYGAALNQQSMNLYTSRLYLPAVLVMGNEEKGIRPGVMKRCEHVLHIPLPSGFDSLNVAQAGAMFMGELARQTRY